MTKTGDGVERAGMAPASQEELLRSIEYSLSYDSRGKASNAAKDLAICVLAGRVVEHLQRSNYIVMKGPPAKSWATPGKSGMPMKE